jgi:hypothetical protein
MSRTIIAHLKQWCFDRLATPNFFCRNRPWTLCLMFAQIVERALQKNMLSGCDPGAYQEKRCLAGFQVLCIPSFKGAIKITTLGAIHTEPHGMLPVAGIRPTLHLAKLHNLKARGAASRLSMLGEDCPASAPRGMFAFCRFGGKLQ